MGFEKAKQQNAKKHLVSDLKKEIKNLYMEV